MDGYLSYLEPGDTGVHGVAMKKWYPKLSSVDFRLLHTGWAHSDAILITASELRNEPEAQIRVLFDDLIEYRQRVLKKPPQPYLVILTRTGDIPAAHPVFHPPNAQPTHCGYPIVIATTTAGLARLPVAELNAAGNVPTAIAFDRPNGEPGVCFQSLFAHLRTNCGIQHVDCGTGGDVIQQLLCEKYIDEMRITLAGQLGGAWNSEGKRRPHFFPARDISPVKGGGSKDKHLFTSENAPHLEIQGIRTAGKRLVFMRMGVTYRH
ncbi:hypothetical protein BC828DRAFT_386087 [Blastocladiella britannica]|nr:hypothetical protein BC828DRAFT_386087 [Blastocladiella britannica]